MNKVRKSGIELLKIIAIFAIVISHVTQTLIGKDIAIELITPIDLNVSTTNFSYFMLETFRYLGILGNFIFFITSAWFLVEKEKTNGNKIINLILIVDSISILILSVFLICGFNVTKTNIIKSVLPIIFQNNWYITSYIIFLIIYPYLNIIINKSSKEDLLKLNIFIIVINFGINFLKYDLLYNVKIINFISIYFLIAFMKKYMSKFVNNKKMNLRLLGINLVIFFGLLIITNILGLKFKIFNNQMLRWNSMNNPFVFMIAISLFNLCYNLKFTNLTINKIASLSLLFYLIHENLLIRLYIRPQVWNYIYNNFGYNFIIVKVLVYSIIYFVITGIFSYIYYNSIQKIINKIVNSTYLEKKANEISVKINRNLKID